VIESTSIIPVPFSPGGGYGTPVAATKLQNVKLVREYVASGPNRPGSIGVPLALPDSVDDVARERGARHYEWMMTDPVVAASVQTLKLSILAGGMDLEAPVKPKPGAKDLTAEETKAKEIVEFCWRCVERCKGWNAAVKGLLDAAAYGNKLAEKIFEVAETGPDKGKLVWKAIKVKPRTAWQFVVDDALNVLGILFRDLDGNRRVLPREKVVVMSWDPVDGDPRGTSVLRPAVDPVNLKRLIWPQLYKHICQFGSASLIGKTAEGEVDRTPVDDDGVPIPGAAAISAQQFMASQLVAFQNGSVLVVPFGAEVEPIQPQGEGQVFHAAIDLFNREIVHAILMQTRATREAEHGSKADSQTGQDVMGLLVAYGREVLAETLRDDLFRHLVALNYGEDDAAEFTPLVTFGDVESHDKSAMWGAAATLLSSGYLGESQLAELDAMIGLPIRDAEADAKAAEEKAAKAMQQQKALEGPQSDPDGPPGNPPSGDGKAPPKPADFARGGGGKGAKAAKKAKAKGAGGKTSGGGPCGANAPGGGGFQKGNTCGGAGAAKSAKKAAEKRATDRMVARSKGAAIAKADATAKAGVKAAGAGIKGMVARSKAASVAGAKAANDKQAAKDKKRLERNAKARAKRAAAKEAAKAKRDPAVKRMVAKSAAAALKGGAVKKAAEEKRLNDEAKQRVQKRVDKIKKTAGKTTVRREMTKQEGAAKAAKAAEKAEAAELRNLVALRTKLGKERGKLFDRLVKVTQRQAKVFNPYVSKGKPIPEKAMAKFKELQAKVDTLDAGIGRIRKQQAEVADRILAIENRRNMGKVNPAKPGEKVAPNRDGFRRLLFDHKTGALKTVEDQKKAMVDYIRANAKPAEDIKAHGMTDPEKLQSFVFDGITYRFADANNIKGWSQKYDKDGKIYDRVVEIGDRPGAVVEHIHAMVLRREALPDALTAHTSEVIFSVQRNNKDPYWEKQYKEPGFMSAATGGDGRVVVYNDFKMGEGTFIHEMGHNMATARYGDTMASNTKSGGISQFYNAAKLSNEKPPSEYATKSLAEDFAESVKYYHTDTERLRREHPKRFAVIDRLHKDLGYAG
jgi:histone H1/5